jgi:hypothetical protein
MISSCDLDRQRATNESCGRVRAPRRWRAALFAAVLGIVGPETAAHAAEIALVPVGATVPHTLVDNDLNGLDDEIIFFDTGPGVAITLDIMLLDWDHEGTTLNHWQANIDSSGYDNDGGPLPDLVPLGWPADPSLGAFQDTARNDWVFYNLASFGLIATESLDYRYGAIVIIPPDPHYAGAPKYGGTLILTVPSGARDTFRVAFDSQSFMMDSNADSISPLLLTPAEITVIPEPSVVVLELLGLGVLGMSTRRRRVAAVLPRPASCGSGRRT